jgi:hypothetical protein
MRSLRIWLFAAVFSIALVATGPTSAQLNTPKRPPFPPFTAEQNDTLPQTLDELRGCVGPVGPEAAKQFTGVRWLCNAFEILHTPIRRALETVAGIDLTGGERGKNSVLEQWRNSPGVTKGEVDFLRSTALGRFYSVLGVPGSGSADPAFQSEDPNAPNYRHAGTGSQEPIFWSRFLGNVIPITQNANGRYALFGLNLLARAENVSQAVDAVTTDGGVYPEQRAERLDAATLASPSPGLVRASPTPVPRSIAGNEVVSPASANEIKLKTYLTAAEEFEKVNPSSYSGVPRDHPDRLQPHVLTGELSQQGVRAIAVPESFADGGALGRVAEISGTGASPTLRTNLVTNDVFQALVRRTANDVNQVLRNSAQAANFFRNPDGSSSAAGLQNIFGPDLFSSLANNLFGSGGPSGGAQNVAEVPTNRQDPQKSVCTGRTPAISEAEAKAAAILLGLPASANPENPVTVSYVPASLVDSVSGTDPRTGTSLTVSTTDFSSPETCVWVASSDVPEEGTRAAFIEDVRAPEGVKVLLTL